MQIYTILDQRLPDQNSDRWLKMYFKTGQSFWNRSREEAFTALYINNEKMAAKRG